MTAFDRAWELMKMPPFWEEEELSEEEWMERYNQELAEDMARATTRDLSHLPQINGKIQYYNTRRGVAFEAPTTDGTIYNDGHGGPTLFRPNTEEGSAFIKVDEKDWNDLISQFEEAERSSMYGGV